MRGRTPSEYQLEARDRAELQRLLSDGLLPQRVARRIQALLALDRGERIVAIVHWVGLSPAALWYLWHRYQERGPGAIFDAERSGRPAVFSLA
jgi:Winged helix-turn helix